MMVGAVYLPHGGIIVMILCFTSPLLAVVVLIPRFHFGGERDGEPSERSLRHMFELASWL